MSNLEMGGVSRPTGLTIFSPGQPASINLQHFQRGPRQSTHRFYLPAHTRFHSGKRDRTIQSKNEFHIRCPHFSLKTESFWEVLSTRETDPCDAFLSGAFLSDAFLSAPSLSNRSSGLTTRISGRLNTCVIDHRRLDVAMAKQLLNRSNIGHVLQQVGCKRMSKRVRCHMLVQIRLLNSPPQVHRKRIGVQMMTVPFTILWIP